MLAGQLWARPIGAPLVRRRASAALACLLAIGAVGTFAACVETAGRPAPWTLATTPYAPPPQRLRGLRLPSDAAGVVALAEQLPARVAGRERLDALERADASGVTVAYGETDGTIGQLPLRLDVVDLSAVPGYAGPTAGDAVLRELNRARAGQGPWRGGRDGDIVWFEQTSVGYRLLWGRADSHWLFVVSAPTADQLDALLAALQQTFGTHGGMPVRTH